MTFSEMVKEAQANLYIKSAEFLTEALGVNWIVTVTKAGRSGRTGQKKALIECQFGTTTIGIATNERGKELKILQGEQKTYSDLSDLAQAVKDCVGDEEVATPATPATEPATVPEDAAPAPVMDIDAAADSAAPTTETTPTNPILVFISNMAGAGVGDDPGNEKMPLETKTDRTYKVSLVWAANNRLIQKLEAKSINCESVSAFQAALRKWMGDKVTPTNEQWTAMQNSMQGIVTEVGALGGTDDLEEFSKTLVDIIPA